MRLFFTYIAFFCIFLSACVVKPDKANLSIETCSVEDSPLEKSSIVLTDNTVELAIIASDDIFDYTCNAIKTNSTQIQLSTEPSNDTFQIIIYLYLSNNLDNHIASATMNQETTEIIFSNLTYSESYTIRAEVLSLEKNVTIRISE